MAHLVQTMAYANETPWHGLGVSLPPDTPLAGWREAAGLNWRAEKSPVLYRTGAAEPIVDDTSFVLYRTDTKEPLSIVSGRYKPVQPEEVISFYDSLTRANGFVMETAGVLAGGKKIWALARTGRSTRVRGNDPVDSYLLLATSYDGSMSTTARFTSVRVVCNNTLSIATDGAADVTVPHTSTFDADRVKFDLGVGEAWEAFSDVIQKLAEREVTPEEQSQFILASYFGIEDDEELANALRLNPLLEIKIERIHKRMQKILTEAPGAQLPSAKNTAWGLVNAVTYDVDYSTRSRSPDTRLNSAWFGAGESQKRDALDLAINLLEAA